MWPHNGITSRVIQSTDTSSDSDLIYKGAVWASEFLKASYIIIKCSPGWKALSLKKAETIFSCFWQINSVSRWAALGIFNARTSNQTYLPSKAINTSVPTLSKGRSHQWVILEYKERYLDNPDVLALGFYPIFISLYHCYVLINALTSGLVMSSILPESCTVPLIIAFLFHVPTPPTERRLAGPLGSLQEREKAWLNSQGGGS